MKRTLTFFKGKKKRGRRWVAWRDARHRTSKRHAFPTSSAGRGKHIFGLKATHTQQKMDEGLFVVESHPFIGLFFFFFFFGVENVEIETPSGWSLHPCHRILPQGLTFVHFNERRNKKKKGVLLTDFSTFFPLQVPPVGLGGIHKFYPAEIFRKSPRWDLFREI